MDHRQEQSTNRVQQIRSKDDVGRDHHQQQWTR